MFRTFLPKIIIARNISSSKLFYSTLNEQEVAKFSLLSAQWWNIEGPLRTLHQINPLRIKYINNHLEQHFQLSQRPNFSPIEPLKNLNILDIGCGGGIATESLARLGANVLGVDASSNNVMIAKSHLLRQPPAIQQRVSYESSLVEKILEQRQAEQKNPFDVVVALEILEHVEQVPQFLETCSKLLKPNGALFLSTLNKTVQSYLLGIVAAEYVLNLVPVGTHDWNKFIRPEDLSKMLSQYQVQVRDVKGLSYTPWKQSISNDTGVNYMLFATKQAPK